MIGFFLMVFGVFLLIAIVKSFSSRPKRQRKDEEIRKISLPENLGILDDSLVPLLEKLNQSLSPNFVANVKSRFMADHPNIEEYEFDWRLFELKRYFIMNSLLKSVPMFSVKVDEVWHEMLMFTKEYESFSKSFYGSFLHHIPNLDSTPIPGERAFFDWIYLNLFQANENSRILWGGFLRHPVQREILSDFIKLSEAELLNKYFKQTDIGTDIQKNLIRKIKKELSQVDLLKKRTKRDRFARIPSSNDYHHLLPAMMFYSLYENDHFEREMNELRPFEEQLKFNSGSGCASSGCGSNDHHNDSDSGSHGGDSGGGSSCSSCGGGCSS